MNKAMSRAERRRIGIHHKDPMISIKQSDIDRMKQEATAKGAKIAFALMLALPVMVIHDKFGMLMKKEGREKRFAELCMEQYKCYEEDYVTIEELIQLLKDEADVEIDYKV